MLRQDRAVQTDDEPEGISKLNKNRKHLTTIRLSPPIAMERIEEFLANNQWRLLDLFRTLDLKKSWNLVKEDFMRLVAKVTIYIFEKQTAHRFQNFPRKNFV